MITKRQLQTFFVGILGFLALSASEPCYSYAPACANGLKWDCRTECQVKDTYFGSYIPVCVFEVQVCRCIVPNG